MNDLALQIRIDACAADEDPVVLAKYLIEAMEYQLSLYFPALAKAYGQLIRGEIGSENWLDPNE